MSIPIVNARREIVGWTDTLPQVVAASMRHDEAERLVGGAITALFVGIDDPVAAKRAGAPDHWEAPWRCIGLCSVAAIADGESGFFMVAVHSRRAAT